MSTETSTETSIKEAIYTSVKDGNIACLKSLADSFPAAMSALRYKNLVDIAFAQRHYDIAIYLIVQHGFEVSTGFEPTKKVDLDYDSLGWNEFHQTLEVLANATLNKAPDTQRNLACYELRNWANNLNGITAQDTETTEIPADTSLSPEFIHLAASGALREFLTHPKDFNFVRAEAHSVKMRTALTEHIDKVENRCRQMLTAIDTPTAKTTAGSLTP